MTILLIEVIAFCLFSTHKKQVSMNQIAGKWAILILLLITCLHCSQEDIDIDTVAEFEAYLQDEIDAQDIPAMSIILFRADEVLYEKYTGQANVEQNIPLAADHIFLLASVSKVITATALLQLYEDGLFTLDEPINDYLPFDISVPGYNTPITFRMLLTHTSGIADGSALDDQYYYGQDSPVALADFLEDYLVPGGAFYRASEHFHDFEPGTQHEYSNVGSALIGLLVEQISGMDFNAYCKEHIFQPMGMEHTFWRLNEAQQSGTTIVQPYDYTGNRLEAIPHYTFTDYPNGGLRSTGSDLMNFLSIFVNDGGPLLQPTTVQAMITPQIPQIDGEVGLHLFLMNTRNTLWGHDGGEQGVATVMAFNLDSKVGVIILTNQGDADLDELLVEAYELGLKL